MDGTPDPNPQTTPEQVAAAAADAKAIALAQQKEHARYNALDIRDPAQAQEPEPESKPAPEKPAESSTIPGANTESWPDHLLQAAWDMGISSDEAKSYGSPLNLERAINLARRMHSSAVRPQPEAEHPPPPEAEEFPFEYPDEVFTEDGKRWFQERDKHFVELTKQQKAELEQIKQQNQQLAQHLQQQHAKQQETDWNNTLVNDTPEEYRDLIGKSLYEADTSQQQKQFQVAKTVQLMLDRAAQDGVRAQPLRVLYKKALAIEFPDVVQNTQEKKVAEKARDAMGQFISKPTASERSANSRPKNMTVSERTMAAERAVAAKMRELGISQN